MNIFRSEIAHLHVADLQRDAAEARRFGRVANRRAADPGCSPLCRAAAIHRAKTR